MCDIILVIQVCNFWGCYEDALAHSSTHLVPPLIICNIIFVWTMALVLCYLQHLTLYAIQVGKNGALLLSLPASYNGGKSFQLSCVIKALKANFAL